MTSTDRQLPVAFAAVPSVPPTVIAHQETTAMHPKPSNEPILLRRPQVQQRTGLSRSTLYEYIKDGEFPAPVRLGARAVGWLESEVSDWIHARVRLTRQSRANAGR